jgi:hypothetical protein
VYKVSKIWFSNSIPYEVIGMLNLHSPLTVILRSTFRFANHAVTLTQQGVEFEDLRFQRQ